MPRLTYHAPLIKDLSDNWLLGWTPTGHRPHFVKDGETYCRISDVEVGVPNVRGLATDTERICWLCWTSYCQILAIESLGLPRPEESP